MAIVCALCLKSCGQQIVGLEIIKTNSTGYGCTMRSSANVGVSESWAADYCWMAKFTIVGTNGTYWMLYDTDPMLPSTTRGSTQEGMTPHYMNSSFVLTNGTNTITMPIPPSNQAYFKVTN